MRAVAVASILRVVDQRTVRIVIDVDVADEEISGTVGDGADEPRPFHGWLGLIARLDRLLAGPEAPGAGQP